MDLDFIENKIGLVKSFDSEKWVIFDLPDVTDMKLHIIEGDGYLSEEKEMLNAMLGIPFQKTTDFFFLCMLFEYPKLKTMVENAFYGASGEELSKRFSDAYSKVMADKNNKIK